MTDDKQQPNNGPASLDEAALDAASGGLPMHGEPEGKQRSKRSGSTQTEDDLYVG